MYIFYYYVMFITLSMSKTFISGLFCQYLPQDDPFKTDCREKGESDLYRTTHKPLLSNTKNIDY